MAKLLYLSYDNSFSKAAIFGWEKKNMQNKSKAMNNFEITVMI